MNDLNSLVFALKFLQYNFVGDPKTKFLRLFLSAVRRPPIRPPKKTSPDFAPVQRPTSDLGHMH